MASVLSLQCGRVAPLGPKDVPSAFVKHPVAGSVRAGSLGLAGDEQADHRVHGGPDKAIYCYPSEHFARWSADVPAHHAKLTPGAFGENITTTELDEESVAIGDVLAIGSAQLQVSQPRQPCFKLGLRFADNSLGKIMVDSGRTGWYVRVLEEGDIQAGDEIRFVRRGSPCWTVARCHDALMRRVASPDELFELSQVEGLADSWRSDILKLLGQS